MNSFEKSVKISLLEKVLAEARASLELDTSISNLKKANNPAVNGAICDVEYDEVAILFSLLEFIIHLDIGTDSLVSASSSTGLYARVSPANEILDIEFVSDKNNDTCYQVKLVFE